MSNVRVGEAIAASFAYIPTAWRGATAIMAVNVLVSAALEFAGASPGTASLLSLPRLAAALILGTILAGALYRIGLQPAHGGDPAYATGPGGFQWGGLEWRVLGANWLLGAILGLAAALVLVVWVVAVLVTVGAQSDALRGMGSDNESDRMAAIGQLFFGPAALETVLILVPAFIGLVYLGARLALVPLHAADTGSFSLGQAWRLTRGAVLALLIAGVLSFVADFAIGAVGALIAGIAASLVGHHDWGAAWESGAGSLLVDAINPPLFAGLQLYVYRAQNPEISIAATFA